MEPMMIFALTGVVLVGGMVYVILKVQHFGETQALADQLLLAQAETATTKKELSGYTQYVKELDAAQQALAARLKQPIATVVREYVHVELVDREKYALKVDLTAIVRYSVEFALGLDVIPSALMVAPVTSGVSLKVNPPSMLAEPKIRAVSHQLIGAVDLANKPGLLADLQARFAPQARSYGAALCAEEAVRALCKLKAQEALRDTLAQQAGVRHLPAIFTEFK